MLHVCVYLFVVFYRNLLFPSLWNFVYLVALFHRFFSYRHCFYSFLFFCIQRACFFCALFRPVFPRCSSSFSSFISCFFSSPLSSSSLHRGLLPPTLPSAQVRPRSVLSELLRSCKKEGLERDFFPSGVLMKGRQTW